MLAVVFVAICSRKRACLHGKNVTSNTDMERPLTKRREPPRAYAHGGSVKDGGYLLSHLRSTIGVGGLNFSVRNGKRWDPAAIATWILPVSGKGWRTEGEGFGMEDVHLRRPAAHPAHGNRMGLT